MNLDDLVWELFSTLFVCSILELFSILTLISNTLSDLLNINTSAEDITGVFLTLTVVLHILKNVRSRTEKGGKY